MNVKNYKTISRLARSGWLVRDLYGIQRRGKLKVTERKTEEHQHGNKRGEHKCFCKSSCGEVVEKIVRLSANYCLILLHSKKDSYTCYLYTVS